jgi:hypothetical protein
MYLPVVRVGSLIRLRIEKISSQYCNGILVGGGGGCECTPFDTHRIYG